MVCGGKNACGAAQTAKNCVVVGNGRELVEKAAGSGCVFVEQSERKGTGHAVMMSADFLRSNKSSDVIVLCGDAPFVNEKTITDAYNAHKRQGNCVTVVTAELDEPTGYGRIVYKNGEFSAIVEQADATDEIKAIKEVNSGIFWFKCEFLMEALAKLTCENKQGEYYLTDVVSIAKSENKRVGTFVAENADVVLGANDRKSLAALNEIARMRIIEKHWANGVDIPVTDGVVIDDTVKIGADTTILAGTMLTGGTVVGEGCVIGPNTVVDGSEIGSGTEIRSSYVYGSKIKNNVKIGPFAHIRPGCVIDDNVKIGDFVEIKNSNIGEKTAVAHLTYVGDSDVGRGVNFGCGVVTVNYDGCRKHRTTIGNDAFIGCNTNLVAPVKVGDSAYTAAGSTITEDVPDNALAIARSRQQNKPDWVCGKEMKKK